MILFFLIFASFFSFGENDVPLELKQLIAIALEKSPELKIGEKTLTVRGLEYKSSWTKLLPTLDLTSAHGVQGDEPQSLDQPWASSMSVLLSESLYDNGVQFSKKSIASLKVKIAEIQRQEALEKLIFQVASAYYKYSEAKGASMIQAENLNILEKQYANIEKQYRQGFKTIETFTRMKAQLENTKIERKTSHFEVQNALVGLYKTVGSPAESKDPLKVQPLILEDKTELPSPWDSKIDLSDCRDILTFNLQEQIDYEESSQIHRQYLPEFFVTSELKYSNSNYLNNGKDFTETDRLSWNALLQVKYNIFDWGIRKRDKEIANQNRQIKQHQYEVQRLSLSADLKGLALQTKYGFDTLSSQRTILGLDRKSYLTVEENFRNGRSSYLDLITELRNFSSSKKRFNDAFFNLKTLEAKTLYYKGQLNEWIKK